MPIGQKMRVGESEGRILRQRDTLRGRRHVRTGAWRQGSGGLRQPHEGAEIEMRLDEVGGVIDKAVEVETFARLHQAEVAGGMRKARFTR